MNISWFFCSACLHFNFSHLPLSPSIFTFWAALNSGWLPLQIPSERYCILPSWYWEFVSPGLINTVVIPTARLIANLPHFSSLSLLQIPTCTSDVPAGTLCNRCSLLSLLSYWPWSFKVAPNSQSSTLSWSISFCSVLRTFAQVHLLHQLHPFLN